MGSEGSGGGRVSGDVWHSDGLRFQCTKCGNCCHNHGQHAFVYVTPPEVEALAAHMELDVAEFHEHYCREDGGWTVLRGDGAI